MNITRKKNTVYDIHAGDWRCMNVKLSFDKHFDETTLERI